MKPGKLDWDDLQSIIEAGNSIHKEEVKINSGIGEDCSVVNFGEYDCVLSTDPITGAVNNIGKLAVNINCNDLASSMAEPIGILVTILAPTTSSLEEIRKVMKDIGTEAGKLNLAILGGHTEVTEAVNKLVVSCTVIGKTLKDKYVSTKGAKAGDSIIVTKNLCLEGTAILCSDYKEYLNEILSEDEIQEALSYNTSISVLKEAMMIKNLPVSSMHDITEGGALGAVFEMALASNVGFEVKYEWMPITDISKKICEAFNIDPLRLISSGSMMLTTSAPEKIKERLEQNGIKATVIGKIIEEGHILYKNQERYNVEPPKRDELFNLTLPAKSKI